MRSKGWQQEQRTGIMCCMTCGREGEVLRSLKKRDSSYSMCCLLGLHVSLPRRLHPWHCPLPLRLLLGGARPDAPSPPGSKALGPPHCLLAIALHHIKKKRQVEIISCITSLLLSTGALLDLKYVFLSTQRHIFSSLEKQIGWRRAPSHAIYPSTAFGLT